MNDAQQIRAQGVPITALDGRELRLLFDIEALAEVEDAFGSLGGMQDALQGIAKNTHNAQFFKPLLQIMRCALVHDPGAADARFDASRVEEYFEAVMVAVDASFPKALAPPTPSRGKPPTRKAKGTGASPGPTSITSPPSNSGGVKARSGA